MRDRLIELIKKAYDGCVNRSTVSIADYLLANGVIVPPCKVGDVVWYITGIHRTLVKPAIVEEIIIDSNGVKDLFVKSENGSFENSIDIFYRSKEEAEQAMRKEDEGK